MANEYVQNLPFFLFHRISSVAQKKRVFHPLSMAHPFPALPVIATVKIDY
jgi:hypothetical protein